MHTHFENKFSPFQVKPVAENVIVTDRLYDPFQDDTRPEYALGLPDRMGIRLDYDDAPLTRCFHCGLPQDECLAAGGANFHDRTFDPDPTIIEPDYLTEALLDEQRERDLDNIFLAETGGAIPYDNGE